MMTNQEREAREDWIFRVLGVSLATGAPRPGIARDAPDTPPGAAMRHAAVYAAPDDLDPPRPDQAYAAPESFPGADTRPANAYAAPDDLDPSRPDHAYAAPDFLSAAEAHPASAYAAPDADVAATPAPTDAPPPATAFDPTLASIGTRIAAGAFGEVSWLNTTQPGLPPMVVKVPLNAAAADEYTHEAAFYDKAGPHPNIVRCLGMQDIDGKHGLVLEGVEGRTMEDTMALLEKLRSGDAATVKSLGMKKQLSQSDFVGTLQYMMKELLTGLAHLEQQGVIHGDIRPDNIMCDRSTGAVKIVDFGLAKDVGATSRGKSPVGYGSAAPEFITGAEGNRVPLTAKFDMFAAGEATRKSMEGDQFRYNATRGRPSWAEAAAFATPDAQGKAKQALNPSRPTVPPAERLAALTRRGTALLADRGFASGPAGRDLARAMAEADAALTGASPLAAEELLRALQRQIDAAASPAARAPEPPNAWLATALTEPAALVAPEDPDAPPAAPTPPAPAGTPMQQLKVLKSRMKALRADLPPELKKSGKMLKHLFDDAAFDIDEETTPKDAAPLLEGVACMLGRLEARMVASRAAPDGFEAALSALWDRLAALLDDDTFLRAVPGAEAELDAAESGLAEIWKAQPLRGHKVEQIMRAAEAIVSRREAAASALAAPPGSVSAEISAVWNRLDQLMKDPAIKRMPTTATEIAKLERVLLKLWNEPESGTEAERAGALEAVDTRVRHEEERLRKTGTFGIETAYTKFVNWAMHPDPTQRPTATEALAHPFIAKRLLDDKAARAVLHSVLGAG